MQVSRTAPISAIPVRSPPMARKGVTGPADHRLLEGLARRSRLCRANAAHGFAGDFSRLALAERGDLVLFEVHPSLSGTTNPGSRLTRPASDLRSALVQRLIPARGAAISPAWYPQGRRLPG